MKKYYECHVTFDGDPILGENMVRHVKWKYSRIDGDPIMGTGVRQYATMHYNARKDEQWIWDRMQNIRDTFIKQGLTVTRCKIELVLRDERYS